MTVRLLVTLEARADIAEAATWLGGVSPNLPPRFAKELEKAYASILEHPQMYPRVYKRFRRALLHTFPYAVFYAFESSLVLIVGVVHQSRDESVWKRRG